MWLDTRGAAFAAPFFIVFGMGYRAIVSEPAHTMYSASGGRLRSDRFGEALLLTHLGVGGA